MKWKLAVFLSVGLLASAWAEKGWVETSWHVYTLADSPRTTSLVFANFRNSDGVVKTWGVFRYHLANGTDEVWVGTGDLHTTQWRAGWVELSVGPSGIFKRASGFVRAEVDQSGVRGALEADGPPAIVHLDFSGAPGPAKSSDRELFSRCFADFQNWTQEW